MSKITGLFTINLMAWWLDWLIDENKIDHLISNSQRLPCKDVEIQKLYCNISRYSVIL